MTQTEAELRQQIVRVARSLFERGLTHGSTGNISVRTADGGLLLTPTGSSFGTLDPARLSKLDEQGVCVAGDPPSKEQPLHFAMYRRSPSAGAVVHLHSPYSVALTLLQDIDPSDALPPLTPYFVMRIGKLPILPYAAPGSEQLAEGVAAAPAEHRALLLAHHGSITSGRTLLEAGDTAEELEAIARLFLLVRGEKTRQLTHHDCEELRRRFPA